MMNRNVLGTIVISVFIGFPLLFLFQNCGSGGGAANFINPSALGQNFTVSGDLAGQVDLGQFEFTSDSGKLVFLADKDVQNHFELYAVNRDSTDSVKLSGGGQVDSFRLAG